jgi:hypothetical protein
MIDIDVYITQLIDLLKGRFGSRLLYVGLQGSYLRGEATDYSDIDVMVVLDDLCVADLDNYREIIQNMDHYDLSCGFICGKEELLKWNPLEICHLINTTKDYYGNLSSNVPEYSEADVRNFCKMSVNNLYHEICHRYIHASKERNVKALPGTYKGVFFILQNLYYLSSGEFVAKKAELLSLLDGNDHAVLKMSMELADCSTYDFDDSFDLLFTWCQQVMRSL